MSETHHATDRNLDRMLFFSDAVFAIVLTLLVLELRPPETEGGDEELRAGIMSLGRRFAAYFWTFTLVGIQWLIHMRMMRRLKAFDGAVAVANLAFLAAIALMPFAAALLGQHFASVFALEVYWCVSLFSALTSTLVFVVMLRDGGRLVGGVSTREWFGRMIQSAGPGIAFAVGVASAILGQVWVSRFCWVLIFPMRAIGMAVEGGGGKAKAA